MVAMISQGMIFEALAHAESYPHPVKSIQVRETHISKVFLTGSHAYKIKKAVNLGFLDFTRLTERCRFCHQELQLNRRLTRDVYLKVVPITSDGRQIGIKHGGQVVEYAVCMRQLSADQSMLRLLRAGKLHKNDIPRIVEVLNRFYRSAPRDAAVAKWGDIELIGRNCADNFDAIEPFGGDVIDAEQLHAIQAAVTAMLTRSRPLFIRRKADGFVRDGHGDLRCGHIYIEDEIQIIDCIEFDTRYRCGDVAADIAFLAMDLDFEGFPDSARQLVETYARLAQDPGLLLLIDFYKCYRAMVRVKVNCLRLQDEHLPLGERNILLRHTRRFMALAFSYALMFSQPTLWVVCGLPAAGKSTLARRLGDVLNCPVHASDPIRKAIFNMDAEASAEATYATGIYTPAADARTYAKLLLASQDGLTCCADVILDATFSRDEQRREALRLAGDQGATIIFVECRAPLHMLEERLAKRSETPGVSDARLHHLPELRARYTPFDEISPGLHFTVDTTQPIEPQLLSLLTHEWALRADQTRKRMNPDT
jgi:uncharacterized protein